MLFSLNITSSHHVLQISTDTFKSKQHSYKSMNYRVRLQLAAAEQEARSPVSYTSFTAASALPELGLAITSSLNRGNDIVARE